MKKPRILGLIVARKNSKGLKNKHLINIKKKTCIEWSFEAANKSSTSLSFKKLDNIVFVFSQDRKAKYNDDIHLAKDKNSLTNPLDKPNKADTPVKKRMIKSAIGIIHLFKWFDN